MIAGMDDLELVREHCHGKKHHKAKTAHKKHGCTPAKSKHRKKLLVLKVKV